ncbi:MAG TPA: acetoacetate--CoA ligase [Gemmatimonadales bacterium]|nr:acetoacetate--CoA ligase [Gemmatimonadales bacterium]
MPEICWTPTDAAKRHSQLAGFIADRQRDGVLLPDPDVPGAFAALHRWSIADRAAFWGAVFRMALPQQPPDASRLAIEHDDVMAPPPRGGATWFPEARLNYAEELLRGDPDAAVLVPWDERGAGPTWTRGALRREVARVQVGLAALGVGPGDRVAGWLPNIPEAIVAMLATASLGAIWTSCSPDFGVAGIVDRFGQTKPAVLIFADAYQYAGTLHDCVSRARELADRLPTVRTFIAIRYLGTRPLPDDARFVSWDDLPGGPDAAEPAFTPLAFDHPLWILYSSGTTGLPKCLVHGAGGSLLQHVKEHRLHGDLRPGERLFYFTTCGWMMWNWLVTGLASGATLVLYDGAPMPPDEPDILWRLADEAAVDVFGTSAKYLAMAEKLELRPRTARRPLASLRAVLSTGSPLAPESFDWVHQELPGVQLSSIAGGTDIVSCFVLGNPLTPVRRGEIQGPGLGMAVAVLDASGAPQPEGVPGELVCLAPFPSMPVAFWHDPGGDRYHAAYFDRWPGVWRHGDWASIMASGGVVISGRSDTTLNPGGVRIGTAEIYRQVEGMPEVLESLVIGQRIPGAAPGDIRVVMFVRLQVGIALDAGLTERIKQRIRDGASPHHVPRVILAVPDLPRTRSGKLSELAVRDVVEGREVANTGALANPESLAHFRDRPELS